MELESLRNLQNDQLKNMLHHLYQNVPFYKSLFNKKGIHPNDIKGIEDLHLLPFTKKEDLRDNYPYKMFATPMHEIRRIHASSGTTGKPTVVGYTQKDLEVCLKI